MKKFTEKKRKEFEEIYEELDSIINKIVEAKGKYGQYPFDYDHTVWSYDGDSFDIEATENSKCGCCSDSTHYLDISWDEIYDADRIIENLEEENKRKQILKEEKKKVDVEKEKQRKEKAERTNYERLKMKFKD